MLEIKGVDKRFIKGDVRQRGRSFKTFITFQLNLLHLVVLMRTQSS